MRDCVIAMDKPIKFSSRMLENYALDNSMPTPIITRCHLYIMIVCTLHGVPYYVDLRSLTHDKDSSVIAPLYT